jgi:uncharacterized protein
MNETVPHSLSPWHAGELAMQATIGAVEKMAEIGRHHIRDHLTEQLRDFFPLLPFIIVGSVDGEGDAWATMIARRPGFVRAIDDRRLALEASPDRGDPAGRGMNEGDAIALLGIELPTRRRNRVNGRIESARPDRLTIGVEQAFGNCPKYIHQRDLAFARDPHAQTPAPNIAPALDDDMRQIIRSCDTLFVTTYVDREPAHRQVDVSHRGGEPGFVRLGADDVLTIPDFRGNRFFATLGNMLVNSRAGLLFVDFTTGDALQLTGRGEVVLDPEEARMLPGAERLWRFTTTRAVHRRDALPLRMTPEAGSQSSSPGLS